MENDIMQREKGEIWRSASKKYYMIPEKKMYDRRDRCNLNGMFGVLSDNASGE